MKIEHKFEYDAHYTEIVDALEVVNHAHWIDNHNGTISCSNCHTWFNKDNRYSYMRYCPYCNIKIAESEE